LSAPSRSDRLKADAVLVGITSLWGVAFPLVDVALKLTDPLSFLALRFVVGAAVLAPVAGRRVFERENLRAGLILGTLLFAGFVMQTVGQLYTVPSRSAFITGLCVIFVPLISAVFFRKAPSPAVMLGIGLATLGLYWLTSADGGVEGANSLKGDLLTLGCAVIYAVHILLNGRFSRRTAAFPLVTVQLAVCSLGAVLCLPFAHPHLTMAWALWGSILFCGVFSTAVAIGLQTWAQARTSSIRAAVIFSLEPVFGALASAMMGVERLGRRELVGGGLILGGVLVSELGSHWLRANRAT